MEYEENTTTQKIGLLLVIAFITFGLYIIGVALAYQYASTQVEEIKEPTPAGSILLRDATTDDLPLQQTAPVQETVNGGTLNTGGYDGVSL